MIHIHPEHFAQRLTPGPLPGVVEQGGISGVLGHDRPPGTAQQQILFHIQPLVCPPEVFRLMGLHPLVLPDRILHAAGHRPGGPEALQKLYHVGSGNLRTVGQPLFQLRSRPLVHVAHGPAYRPALPVHQDKSLHLGAEGQTGDLFRRRLRPVEDRFGGAAHGLPPLLRLLLRAAVLQEIEPVPLLSAGEQPDLLLHGKKTGFHSRRTDVIGQHIGHMVPSQHIHRLSR